MVLHDDIARAIAQKSTDKAIRLLFEGNPPAVRLGRGTETDLWDFKSDCPGPSRDENSENAWAHIAADVLGFYNNRGGLLLFGIDDVKHRSVGATRPLDSRRFNDGIRRYVGDTIWIDFNREYIQSDQRFLGVALIPPRGPTIARFKCAAPLINGRRHFERGGAALREHDSTRILNPTEADATARARSAPTYGKKYSIDQPYYRVLAPEYAQFLPRGSLGDQIEKSMRDKRIAVTSLIGVGGMGKTALATWAANRAFDSNDFSFIISTTAKDRELTATGIIGLTAPLTSFEDLLDQVSDVLGFPELKSEEVLVREREVKGLIAGTNGMLYVDNLESVDDKRLISFLDDLPQGVTALVTSRRNSVRTAARPIDIPSLSDDEILAFVKLLREEPSFQHITALSNTEAVKLGRAWDGIPLAMRWAIARTKSVAELLQQAETPPSQRLHGDQLLEFSFRRVFDKLNQAEKNVLETLSVLEQPLPTEALVAGAASSDAAVLDAADELVDDGLVQRVFDADRNDYCFAILPITRAFTRLDMQRRPIVSRDIQRRLTGWFEATDVADSDDRLVVREVRSGKNSDDRALVDLATSAERRSDFEMAESLYRQALNRNPRSWRAAKAAAEFYKNKRVNNLEALTLYEVAVANAPKRGLDRALIFRECALLLRDSGKPDGVTRAEEHFLVALEETPDDIITIHGLATCYARRGAHRNVIELLEPLSGTNNPKTRRQSLPLLLTAYDRTNEMLKAANLRRVLGVSDR